MVRFLYFKASNPFKIIVVNLRWKSRMGFVFRRYLELRTFFDHFLTGRLSSAWTIIVSSVFWRQFPDHAYLSIMGKCLPIFQYTSTNQWSLFCYCHLNDRAKRWTCYSCPVPPCAGACPGKCRCHSTISLRRVDYEAPSHHYSLHSLDIQASALSTSPEEIPECYLL